VKARAALPRDERGAALVEFALVAPILILALLGLMDMGYNYYIQAQLQGTVQKAARDATLERALTATGDIDASVAAAVRRLVPGASLEFARSSYSSFADVDRAEDFSDLNDDGRCSDGEPFEDANGNDQWDEDRGKQGTGGARDAVLYEVTVTYPRAFGIAGLIGLPTSFTTHSSTVLRNQPWGEQISVGKPGNCA
jgi:Flp pilus assembly protein TadG